MQTHGYSAEFGRAAGGIVSAVTKSGTNNVARLRRSSSTVTARWTPAASSTRAKLPDFVRNQFGGSVGGPIRKNDLFFFGRLRGPARTAWRHADRPAAEPRGTRGTAAGDRRDPASGRGASHGAAVPRPALPDPRRPGLRRRHRGAAPRASRSRERRRDRRTDRLAREHERQRDAAHLGRSIERRNEPAAPAVRQHHGHRHHLPVRPSTSASSVQAGSIPCASRWNRTGRHDDMVPTVDVPAALNFTEDPHFGSINIIGLSMVGSTASVPIKYLQDLFQVSDTITWNRGPHVWKLGADWQHYGFSGYSVLAVRRRVPVQESRGVPHAPTRGGRAGGPVHRQPAGHRYETRRAPVVRGVLRAGRLAARATGSVSTWASGTNSSRRRPSATA